MFLDELSDPEINKCKVKQVKKEYAAGFKNYHHPKRQQTQTDTLQNSEDDVLFSQLKIGNLKELYIQSQPVIKTDNHALEKQKKTISRLVPAPISRKKQDKDDSGSIDKTDSEEKQKRMQNTHKFQQIYHKEKNFQEKAHHILFKKQFQKLKEKLSDKIQLFNHDFSCFIIQKSNEFRQKNIIANDQLCLIFTNYINEMKGKNKNQTTKSIQKKQLQTLLNKNIFLFGFYDLMKFKQNYLTISQLQFCIRTKEQFQKCLQDKNIQNFINKKFTVPFEIDLYQVNDHRNIILTDQKGEQKIKIKFKANPIPKSTYHKPKQRPKSQFSKTQTQPFNFTGVDNGKPKINAEDFYKWDRNFHAKEAPHTTYKPNMVAVTLDENEHKRRALQLLQNSQFPATMTYLKDYNKYIQQKHESLINKYSKKRQTEHKKQSIPNFEQIHKNQIIQLQTRKLQNRQLTQLHPFNLSQPRPKKQIFNQKLIIEDQNIKKIIKKSKIQAESTMKYEAYVNNRKKIKEEQLQKEQNRQKQQKKKQKAKKDYMNILKDRVQDQINRSPKAHLQQITIDNNKVRVNLQKIYQQQPLLMQRQTAKSKKHREPPKLDWIPII